MVGPDLKVKSHKELAAALGVAKQRLSEWKAKGCPIGSKAPYDVEKIRKWAAANLTRSKPANDAAKEASDEESLHTQKLREEVRLKRAQADQEELKRDKMRGELIEVEAAKAEISGVVQRIKQAMFAMPRSNSPEFVLFNDPNELEDAWTTSLIREFEGFANGE